MTGPPTMPIAEPIECRSHLYRSLRAAFLAALEAPPNQRERILREWLMTYLHAGKPTAADRVTAFDGVDRLAIWAEIHRINQRLDDQQEKKNPTKVGRPRPDPGV